MSATNRVKLSFGSSITQGTVAAAFVVGAALLVTWVESDRIQHPTMDSVFLAELKENAGCDPTTLVPFEQLDIRLTKTAEELLVICERYVPSRKFRLNDLERK